MIYDVAVVGAGPAGLMAAQTASQKGLQVILLEKFKDISTIRRACCQQLVMDEHYENEDIQITPEKILFPKNGFAVNYDGPAYPITATAFVSPSGRTVHFSYADKRPVAIKIDKGLLLKTLLETCRSSGVVIHDNTTAYHARDAGGQIEIHTIFQGRRSSVRAKKLIAADGVNSRMAEALGFNRQRMHFATALCIIYSLEGLRDFNPTVMTWYMGRAYCSNAPVIIDPSLKGRHVADLVIMGSAAEKPEQIFTRVTTQSRLAPLFKTTHLIGRTGCTVKAYSSLLVPYKGNVLITGDAAAYVEVEMQGGLMCGYHAGNAVYRELRGEDGFADYTAWWQRSFEFNSDQALRVAQGYALVPTFADDEIDYLFALIEGRALDGAYGQYRAPRLLWEAIGKHTLKIQREKPALHRKIQDLSRMTLQETFRQPPPSSSGCSHSDPAA